LTNSVEKTLHSHVLMYIGGAYQGLGGAKPPQFKKKCVDVC
jgi:hypothetical protein